MEMNIPMSSRHFIKNSLIVLLFVLLGCAPQNQWQLQDVAGHLPDLRFSLTSDNGKSVTAENYKGDVVLLYFGFTGCSAQCPVVMQHLAVALHEMGRGADNLRILFVTVDPAGLACLYQHIRCTT